MNEGMKNRNLKATLPNVRKSVHVLVPEKVPEGHRALSANMMKYVSDNGKDDITLKNSKGVDKSFKLEDISTAVLPPK